MIRLVLMAPAELEGIVVENVGGTKFTHGALNELFKDGSQVFELACTGCSPDCCRGERVFVALRDYGDALLLKEVKPDAT